MRTLIMLGWLLVVSVPIASAESVDEARRAALSARGKEIFRNTGNHCHAFRDVAAAAVERATNPGQALEDLKFVLIGTGLLERGKGPHYIGNTPGARGDTGFQSQLRDKSPQVEHAMAAIYLGKFPPGTTEGVIAITEVMGPLAEGGKLNSADALLYLIGSDLVARLSASNYKDMPKVIERTMCN